MMQQTRGSHAERWICKTSTAKARAKCSEKLAELEGLRSVNKTLWTKIFSLEGTLVSLQNESLEKAAMIRKLERSFMLLNNQDQVDFVLEESPEIPETRNSSNSSSSEQEILAPSSDDAFDLANEFANAPSEERLLEIMVERLGRLSYEIGEARLSNETLCQRIGDLEMNCHEVREQNETYRQQIEVLQSCFDEAAKHQEKDTCKRDDDDDDVEESESSYGPQLLHGDNDEEDWIDPFQLEKELNEGTTPSVVDNAVELKPSCNASTDSTSLLSLSSNSPKAPKRKAWVWRRRAKFLF